MAETYLISIRPKYAYRIFAGTKKFELRRWFGITPTPGSRLIVYASGGVKAIIGEFRAGRIYSGSPRDVESFLEKLGDTGVGREDYTYISGARRAMAIEVKDPRLYAKPIRLSELRTILPGFNPPQSFRRLDEYDPLIKVILRKVLLSSSS
jgi:predicted transcriptional regulator